MKYWTIQRKFILDVIDKEGLYQPDFARSEYITSQIPECKTVLARLYNRILKSFNKHNKTELPGLIFSFVTINDNKLSEIRDVYELKSFMRNKPDVLKWLVDHYSNEDMVVLELEYNQNFNPIYVDFNDFQFLMPPVRIIPPFTKYDVDSIHKAIYDGRFYQSKYPAGVIQAHLPNISRNNIVNIYDFDL